MRHCGAGGLRGARLLSAVLALGIGLLLVATGAGAAEGDLDTSFGSGGVVKTSVGSFGFAWSLLRQSDGKLILTGTATSPVTGLPGAGVARYNADGSPDASFGNNGLAVGEIPNGGSMIGGALQPDGKILVVGGERPPGGQEEFVVARLRTDGSLDPAFGSGGVVTLTRTGYSAEAEAVAVQPNGKIVAAGYEYVDGPGRGTSNFLVVRLNGDGSLDSSFGSGGRALLDSGPGTEDAAVGVALQTDGRIVVTGSTTTSPTADDDFAVARLTSAGAPDATFGTSGTGIVRVDISGGGYDDAYGALIQTDGKIVAVGGDGNFELLRLNADGTPDVGFGSGGVSTFAVGGNGYAYSAQRQADGKLVVGGYAGGSFALARLQRDGTLDSSFGNGGVVLSQPVPGNSYGQAVVIQPDGKIAFGGSAIESGHRDFVLQRFLGAPPVQATTERVSVDSSEQQANGGSFISAISGDGTVVAFESNASNLVSGDTNFDQDVFVRDRVAGTTERVSTSSGGSAQANQNSGRPAISADGRYVAFESMASNLVAGGTNGWSQVFVHDRQTGSTELVSVDSSGVQGDNASDEPAISADGRYVAFTSLASNLVPGDTNGAIDVFVHDRLTGTTERVSVDSSGAQADGDSWPYAVAISGGGRYVAFSSDATNLVSGDTNGTWDAFVHDRQTGETERVSVDSAGQQISGSGNYFGVAIDGDGGRVAFESDAPDVVPGETGAGVEVFVRDRVAGTTTMASVDNSSVQAPGSFQPAMSADGHFVAFATVSALAAGDVNNTVDVYVRDLSAGTTQQVSVDGAGNAGNNYSQLPSVDSDGGTFAFASDSTNLAGSDTDAATDVYVHTFGASQPAPGAPTNAVAAAGDASASVSWVAATPNGSPITSYTVIPSPAGPTVTVDGSTTTASVTGLNNGTSYTFTVVAAAGSQTGPPSAPTAPVTPTAGAKTPTTTAANVPPGGTATTDPAGNGPTADSPTTAAVSVPAGGTVEIAIASNSTAPPTGFFVLGEQVTINAPTATAAQPLTLSFVLDASLVGALTPSAVQVFRTDGPGGAVEVQNCSGPGATPDPCVQSRTLLTGGDLKIVVLTSSASIWSLAADQTAPAVTCGSADGNWHAGDVMITCSASDSGSGLANSSDAQFLLTTSVATGTETSTATTNAHQVCDKANNCTTAGPIGGNKVDKKQPTETITTPAAGAVYKYKQPVTAGYGCGDGGSGIATCLGTATNGGGSAPDASGAALPTSYPGAAALTVAAKDNVGNTSTASRSYSVLFNFSGFYAPIANAPAINQVSSGKNVAVPFKLTDYSGTSVYSSLGTNILVPGYPAAKAVACPAGATINKISSYTNQSGLRYDGKNARYEYDLPIPATWITASGTCQQMTVKFRDGTSQSFYLSVTK